MFGYPQDQFFRLMEEAEAQGSVHLDETHINVYHSPLTGPEVPGEEVQYCNASALFEVSYQDPKDEPGVVKVCAVDDRMGNWPRFAAAKAPGEGV